MDLDPGYMLGVLPELLPYLPVTLLIAVVSMVLAVLLGLVLALIRFARIPVLDQIAQLYISLFRGIPTLVQLFLIYYGLPQLFPAMSTMSALTAAIIGFSLKEASYLAEIFRAALASVDRGQYEAGLATGMTRVQVYRRYIIPQAAFNALPATGNIFVSLLKETSVAFTLGLTEIFAEAKIIASSSFRFFETFLVVGLVYWVMVVVYSWLQQRLEQRLGRAYRR
ncbi:amino acid ABC transporter permease [Brachybacterium nesterenkovii]|uniref:Amino acid ABC transporter, permease protein n=1 Tax=Brachybacterium nesterenkovii TaxID=47847 RepID=A0A1X6X4V9_9MICO|nr:amino acid ABC transporter permease [Brachybacterium nesterenkovii]SLM94054.1 Amino acid ABC transporter, permease protein [Brachybacterium nesterenkovii]